MIEFTASIIFPYSDTISKSRRGDHLGGNLGASENGRDFQGAFLHYYHRHHFFLIIFPAERFQKLGVAICFFIANSIFIFTAKVPWDGQNGLRNHKMGGRLFVIFIVHDIVHLYKSW